MKRLKMAYKALVGKSVLLIADGNVYNRAWRDYLMDADTLFIKKDGDGHYTIRVRFCTDGLEPNIAIYEIKDSDDTYANNRVKEVFGYITSEQ